MLWCHVMHTNLILWQRDLDVTKMTTFVTEKPTKGHISIIHIFKFVYISHTTTLGSKSSPKRVSEISQLAALMRSLKVDSAAKLSNQVNSSSTIINLVVSRLYLVFGLVH